MLSQPATKIFLKTTEPNAAERVSRVIGKVEIERMDVRLSNRHIPRKWGAVEKTFASHTWKHLRRCPRCC
jgi:hypothetical protein